MAGCIPGYRAARDGDVPCVASRGSVKGAEVQKKLGGL